tara:strand:+ start:280 stop:798 length:519 start_codon:yes stop_codon:yes gene_type:complete
MARSKVQQNSINLDPNREKISVNMSLTPGDPSTQMNNPDNVLNFGPQLSAMPQGPNGATVNKFPYQDKGLVNATQLGAIDPAMVGRSQVPTSMPVGRGYQGNTPFGAVNTLQAPADYMAAVGINTGPGMAGKPQSAMGLTGQPAMMPDPMAMVPGSTKTTIAKKGKSNKGNA